MTSFTEAARELVVTVYGPHEPRRIEKKLDGLCKALRNSGYANSFMVKNREDVADYPGARAKSFWYVDRSDANIFVFPHPIKAHGHAEELEHLLHSPRAEEDVSLVIVEFESKTGWENLAFSEIALNGVRDFRIRCARVAEGRTDLWPAKAQGFLSDIVLRKLGI